MTTVVTARLIHARAEKVWSVISDFNNVDRFHPFVASADAITEREKGVGAQRQCNLYNNSSAIEEVVAWDEGRSFTVALRNAKPPFGDTVGKMGVDVIDASTSRVYVETTYVPAWGRAGRVLDVFVLRTVLRLVLGHVLRSLKRHIEQGHLIGKGGKMLMIPSPKSASGQSTS